MCERERERERERGGREREREFLGSSLLCLNSSLKTDSSISTQLAVIAEGLACSCPQAKSDTQPRLMGIWPGVPVFRGTLQSLPMI